MIRAGCKWAFRKGACFFEMYTVFGAKGGKSSIPTLMLGIARFIGGGEGKNL